jgi:GNAT superfamily N-acetyltransferase
VDYHVGRARADELAKLAAVERAAGERFREVALASRLDDDDTSLAELTEAHAGGLVWVARAADGEPVGFALVELLDGEPHLEEMDVHPAHGRRGLGRALLDAVFEWAAAAGHRGVTLTTFRDVPWNAPFYARAGFRVVAPAALPPGLAARVREEAARGLDPSERVAMRRDLASAPPRR